MRLHLVLIASLATTLPLVAGCDKYCEPEGSLAETRAWDAAHPDLPLHATATAPPVADTTYAQCPSGPGTPAIVSSPGELSRYAVATYTESQPASPAAPTATQQSETK